MARLDRIAGRLNRLARLYARDPLLAPALAGDAARFAGPERVCVFCGATEHVIPFRGRGICVDCVREVREAAGRP